MILILFLQGTSPCSPLVSATFLYPPSRFAVIIPHLGISLLKTVATGTGKVKEATLFSSPVGHRYLFTAPPLLVRLLVRALLLPPFMIKGAEIIPL